MNAEVEMRAGLSYFLRGPVHFLWFFFVAVLFITSALATERPNIVVILADDLGAADLGCYGADLHETPRLDGFAKESVLFRQAYASAPVCSPTRAALMTGKHPARVGITIWAEGSIEGPKNRKLFQGESKHDLPFAEVTLAERLHDAGYATALVGKWHLGDGDHAPETQGFDVSIGGTRWGAPTSFFWPYRGSGRFGQEFRYVPGLPLGKPGDFLTDKLTDAAIAFIDSAGKQPFCLYLAHHAPHTPIEAPKELVDHFQARLKPEMKHQNAGYAAMVKNLDENVGRVLDHLKTRGLLDNTIVVFTSDNGGYIGVDRKSAFSTPCTNNYPLRSGKGSLYEGGTRVPLIVRWPGAAASERTQPVHTCDLFFTLLAATGLQPAVDLPADGLDLSPLLKNSQSKISRNTLYWHYPHYYETTTPVSSIRSGDWKLLEYYEDDRRELFNLHDDPIESQDLAKSQPDRVTELSKQLTAWRNDVGAKLPQPNPDFRAKGQKKDP
jgi:arylsulfatase A-like enzyme